MVLWIQSQAHSLLWFGSCYPKNPLKQQPQLPQSPEHLEL